MRKHIGAKVYSMLAILLAIFLINTCFSLIGTINARNAVQVFSDTYMQMIVHNDIVTKNVTEGRLCANLIVLTPDEQTALEIADSVPPKMEETDAAFHEMEELCFGLNNPKLTQELQEYRNQYETLRRKSQSVQVSTRQETERVRRQQIPVCRKMPRQYRRNKPHFLTP